MAYNNQERLEEELAKIDPVTLQYLNQLLAENAPAVRKVVQNVLEEPISQETQARLQKPLLPKPYQTKPPRQRKSRKTQELLREYDPFPAWKIRTVTDYQKEILDMFHDAENEGEESTGRHYIRWRFIRGLGRNLTPDYMAKIRQRVSTSFYLRHVFLYQLCNIEDGTVIVYYSNPKGSQWFNKLEDAEKWLITQEELCLDNERVERPSTKWVSENFFNVDVKVVLDRQPLVAQGLCLTGCATLPIAG